MSRFRGLALATGLIGILAGCGAANAATPSTPAAHNYSGSPISIQISLDHSRITAGTPIPAHAVLINRATTSITVERCAADGWLFVGLANRQIRFDPAGSAVACAPSIKLAPGKNRFPISVMTTYQGCLQPGGQSITYVPACTNGGQLPPLPPGIYESKVVTYGLPAGTQMPRSVKVTLTRNS